MRSQIKVDKGFKAWVKKSIIARVVAGVVLVAGLGYGLFDMQDVQDLINDKDTNIEIVVGGDTIAVDIIDTTVVDSTKE